MLWSSPVCLVCNGHCTLVAILCIGAEQIKMLWGFSDNSRCTVAGHELNDRKPWNRQCATNFESYIESYDTEKHLPCQEERGV